MNYRTLSLFLFLLLSGIGFSQDIISFEQPELKVFYRGYPNQFLVNIPENSDLGVNDIKVSCMNCSISKANKPGGYIVKPGSGKKTVITLSATIGDSVTELQRSEYRVSNLPDPILYWGGSKSGIKASKSSRVLLAKYTPEIPLKAAFKVTKWTIVHDGETVTGLGGSLSAAGEIIKSLEPGEQLCITATVVGPDGIARQVGGGWNL